MNFSNAVDAQLKPAKLVPPHRLELPVQGGEAKGFIAPYWAVKAAKDSTEANMALGTIDVTVSCGVHPPWSKCLPCTTVSYTHLRAHETGAYL
eukprot:5994319-Pyramimonas_sp.AAC.1